MQAAAAAAASNKQQASVRACVSSHVLLLLFLLFLSSSSSREASLFPHAFVASVFVHVNQHASFRQALLCFAFYPGFS
ncbi:hypothetical protein V1517DRAFT_328400 [Lipomyces orientalis]|uniref:Uncharacterized protein n=1 Tax=Lipomyces orientalis TaxID=1233043 RepID=A0ACC3TIS4_9ASCO